MSLRSACGVALGLFAAACGTRDSRPSVVLVLVDQLRKDAADSSLTATHALAERGVRFENVRAVAPWTYPSVISMFSGLYPQQHGADGHLQDGTRLTTFSEDVPLLPRLLREAGYHTSGFVTNPFLHEWNPFHRAFDHYDASFIRNPGNRRGLGDLVWTERMFADSVNAAVRAYFDAREFGGPEFTYVHYIDVHGRREGEDRWKDAPFPGDYASAIRYVDAKIVELYEYFLARYGGNLVFVVTSDHGQDLGDDLAIGTDAPRRKRKASMHDFNLRIPLYVLPSARVEEPRAIEEPVVNLDLFPTLCEWLDVTPPVAVAGESLLPLIRGEAFAARERPLYARMSAFGRLDDCLVHRGTKFIRTMDPLSGQVVARSRFDLGADPRETRSLSGDFGSEEELLREAAGDHGLSYRAVFEAPDPAVLDALRDLGYLGEAEEDGAEEEEALPE
jgi:arylsulfatase A-like enzyme